jgi:hypothetical protein
MVRQSASGPRERMIIEQVSMSTFCAKRRLTPHAVHLHPGPQLHDPGPEHVHGPIVTEIWLFGCLFRLQISSVRIRWSDLQKCLRKSK